MPLLSTSQQEEDITCADDILDFLATITNSEWGSDQFRDGYQIIGLHPHPDSLDKVHVSLEQTWKARMFSVMTEIRNLMTNRFAKK